jgi:phage terminase large subunit-like protein
MGNDLAAQCRLAEQMPSYENSFKRLFLNIWTTQNIRWLPMKLWEKCKTEIDFSSYKGRACYAGLDLATSQDIVALALAFPETDGTITCFWRFWCPLETALEREMRQKVPYQRWIKAGHMIGTPGNAVDFEYLRKDINALGDEFRIVELAVDRNFNAHQLSGQLTEDGFTVIPFGQGYFSMSAPSRHLETILLRETFRHNGDPVAHWMASNVAAEMDAAGNIKPSKKKSKEKIDGIVALVMALGRLIVHNNSESVYETRGVILI